MVFRVLAAAGLTLAEQRRLRWQAMELSRVPMGGRMQRTRNGAESGDDACQAGHRLEELLAAMAAHMGADKMDIVQAKRFYARKGSMVVSWLRGLAACRRHATHGPTQTFLSFRR